MFTSILTGITTLLGTANRVIDLWGQYMEWQKQVQAEKIATEIHEIRKALNQPTSSEEKNELAKRLGSLTSKL